MSLSESNRHYAEFLRDIYEVSGVCSTRTYIWGGMTIDILEGRILREHHGIDGFTLNLLDILDDMIVSYKARGYSTEFRDDVDMLRIEKGRLHAAFNRLEIDEEIAMWRHIGDEGTVYFPREWLDDVPRDFYDTKAFISGIEFEYSIKAHPKLLGWEGEPREKDIAARRYLSKILKEKKINPEDVLHRIWSYNPYLRKRGLKEYAMPCVAWPLQPW